MASATSPKRVLKSLADITGFGSLPPLFGLGFSFSEWADISAEIVIRRDENFETKGFPVDIFWLDINHTKEFEFFKFDKDRFPEDAL
jgi:alpha-glucosidase (family GH31 glycosyl hydrolase)